MDTLAARETLFVHAGLDCSGIKRGILHRLRPYQGIAFSDFFQIMEAIIVLYPNLSANEKYVDREIIFALWNLCYTVRLWALNPQSVLQLNHLILSEDVSALEKWADIIERTVLHSLQKHECRIAFFPFAEYIETIIDRYASLVDSSRPIIAAITGLLQSNNDDKLDVLTHNDIVLTALSIMEKLGTRVKSAAPIIREVSEADNSSVEVRNAALRALRRIEGV